MVRVATAPDFCTMLDELLFSGTTTHFIDMIYTLLVILIFVHHFGLRSKIGKIFCNSFRFIGLQPCAKNEARPKVIFSEKVPRSF